MALLGGTITGFILRIPIWDQPSGDQIFDDEDFWLIEAGFPEVHEGHHQDTHTDAHTNTHTGTHTDNEKGIVVTQFNVVG